MTNSLPARIASATPAAHADAESDEREMEPWDMQRIMERLGKVSAADVIGKELEEVKR